MASKKRTLWATTQCGTVKVLIYRWFRSPRSKTEGKTWPFYVDYGVLDSCEIDLADKVFGDPELFDETLIHELIHVVEFMHKRKDLDHTTNKGCSKGAVRLGKGLSQMLRGLAMAPVAVSHQTKP